jgi:hypothetical protein
VPLKKLFLGIVLMQIPLFALAARAEGWTLYAFALGFMVFVFGAIPFTDALIVRYVDDRMRSRVAGLRLATRSASARWRCTCSGRSSRRAASTSCSAARRHRHVLGDRDPRLPEQAPRTVPAPERAA